MTQIVVDFNPEAMSVLRKNPKDFAREVKTAAVVQWYAEGRVSQSKACEILGFSRTSFLDELKRRRVAAFQVDIDELHEEIESV